VYSPVMEMDGDGRISKLQRGGRDDVAPGFDGDSATRERGGAEEIGAGGAGARGGFYRAEGEEEGPARRWGGGTQWPAMNGLVVERFGRGRGRGGAWVCWRIESLLSGGNERGAGKGRTPGTGSPAAARGKKKGGAAGERRRRWR
jgi:hypothetical protein